MIKKLFLIFLSFYLISLVSAQQSVVLTWNDNSDDESGFHIERSIVSTSFSFLASVSAGVTQYTDSSINNYTTYYYRIAAYNSYGNSSYSNTVVVNLTSNTVTILPPTGGTSGSGGSSSGGSGGGSSGGSSGGGSSSSGGSSGLTGAIIQTPPSEPSSEIEPNSSQSSNGSSSNSGTISGLAVDGQDGDFNIYLFSLYVLLVSLIGFVFFKIIHTVLRKITYQKLIEENKAFYDSRPIQPPVN